MQIKIELAGTTPLMQHNVRLSNPMDPFTKALSEAASAFKRDRTDANFYATARIEWEGSLYYHAETGVYVPSSWLVGSLSRGGVLYGRQGKAVKQGLVLEEMEIALLHDGPATLDEMWEDLRYRDTRGVKVGQAMVQRTRPVFPKWALSTTAYWDETVLDLSVLRTIGDKAGALAGIGEYRPEKGGPFGRYTITINEV